MTLKNERLVERIAIWLDFNGYEVVDGKLVPEITIDRQQDLIRYLRKKEENGD